MIAIPKPTRLVDVRRVKRSGVGGPKIKEYKDEHGNWYTNVQLGGFYDVPANTLRNRIDKNGYDSKHILQPRVKRGFKLDGSKVNTSHKGGSYGNAEWAKMGG